MNYKVKGLLLSLFGSVMLGMMMWWGTAVPVAYAREVDPPTPPQILATYVSGTITEDTIWTTTGSPYVITGGGVTVRPDVTLTIEPGVVIKMDGIYTSLTINGTLQAQGTAANPVYITSLKDDTVGGDTNGDGNATTPATK
jgi:hypothetical protein